MVYTETQTKSSFRLAHYKMSPEFAERYAAGEQRISQFKGTITFTPLSDLPQQSHRGRDSELTPIECEEEVIEIPENPNPGGSGGGTGSGGGVPGVPDELTAPDRGNCWYWDEQLCSEGTSGHVGNVGSCIAAFKGATFLKNRCTGESIRVYRTMQLQEDPCTPAGEIGVLEPIEQNNCEELKKLYENDISEPGTKPNIIPQVEWLEQKVDEMKEYGVELKKSVNFEGDMVYEPTQVNSPANHEVLLSQNSYTMGWFHSHPINGYGMFSYQDLRFFRNGYQTMTDSRKPEAFTIIVCRDKTDPTKTRIYALKIDDFNTFSQKVDAIWNSPLYSSMAIEKERLRMIHNDQARKYHYYEGDLEFSFLQQFEGFGISLYKANDSHNNWIKLELQPESGFFPPLSVKQIPCN